MNDSDHGDEIVRLEAQIDELAASVESCRKLIVAGRIAVAGGGVVLVAMVIGAIRLDPSVMAGAVAAVLAGIVAAGSNRSMAKEATHGWPRLRQSGRHSSSRSIFGLFPETRGGVPGQHIRIRPKKESERFPAVSQSTVQIRGACDSCQAVSWNLSLPAAQNRPLSTQCGFLERP